MKTLEMTAIVTADGKMTLQLPPDIPPGEHQVVLVIEVQPTTEKPLTKPERPPLNFPVDSYGSWPDNLSLRREEIYD